MLKVTTIPGTSLTFIQVNYENATRIYKFKTSKKGANIRRANAAEQADFDTAWIISGSDVFDAVAFLCDMLNIDYPAPAEVEDEALVANA